MPKLKRLSQKQKGFCKSFVDNGGNGTEAVLENYNCKNRNMASVIACNNMDKPMIRQELERIMEAKEIKPELMMDKLKEGMDANVASSFEGQVSESDVPDHYARFKWWDAAAKIMSLYPAEEKINKNLNLDIQLESMPKEQFIGLLRGLLSSAKKEEKEEEQGNHD